MTPPHSSKHQVERLEDFTEHEWCNTLLSDPSITKISKRNFYPVPKNDAPNTFFNKTLFTDDAIRASLSLYRAGRGRGSSIADAEIASDALLGDKQGQRDNRAAKEKGLRQSVDARNGEEKERPLDRRISTDEPEALLLVSIGQGIDGGISRLHGGVTATLLDQVMGMLISYSHENTSATAELNIKYKKPITTPCVLLCRSRIVREAGRWIETVGWVEDGEGAVFAEGRGAFVKSKVGNGNGNGDGHKAQAKL